MKLRVPVPNEIQIGCHIYGVFLKDKSIPSDDGKIDFLSEDIRIKDSIPKSRKAVVLIHEALHLISIVYGVGLDEEQCENLSEGLGQLLFADMGIELDWSSIPTKIAVVKEEDK